MVTQKKSRRSANPSIDLSRFSLWNLQDPRARGVRGHHGAGATRPHVGAASPREPQIPPAMRPRMRPLLADRSPECCRMPLQDVHGCVLFEAWVLLPLQDAAIRCVCVRFAARVLVPLRGDCRVYDRVRVGACVLVPARCVWPCGCWCRCKVDAGYGRARFGAWMLVPLLEHVCLGVAHYLYAGRGRSRAQVGHYTHQGCRPFW